VSRLFGQQAMLAVMLGGASLLLAAVATAIFVRPAPEAA
jgi:hypothetical protein